MVSLTHYLLYLVAISHTKSCQDVLKPGFWTKISRFGMELGIMCPAVGIPCQRCEFERLAPPLPDNLCEKIGDSDALQIMDTKRQPSSTLGQTTRPWKHADPKSTHLCGKNCDSDALHTTDTKLQNRMPPEQMNLNIPSHCYWHASLSSALPSHPPLLISISLYPYRMAN